MNVLKNIVLSSVASVSVLSAGGHVEPTEVPAVEVENNWNYELQLYALAPWIQGDTSLGYHRLLLPGDNSMENVAVDMTPKTIVDNLNMGAMAHFEAHREQGWGLWLDYVFMDLGKDLESEAELGMFQGILEAFATYRVPMEQGYIDYFAGVRWWSISMDLTIENKNRERSFNWYDPVLGMVWVTPINDNWKFRARADVGGFGIESDFTAAIEIGALYAINENWQVDMRFKSLWVDYEEGNVGDYDRFKYDTVSYGPIVGITYKF
jgi:hypothetical protein